jgi:hypothetical protein
MYLKFDEVDPSKIKYKLNDIEISKLAQIKHIIKQSRFKANKLIYKKKIED